MACERTVIKRADVGPTFIAMSTKNLLASLDRAGERLTFGVDPSDVPGCLAARGLSLEQDVGAARSIENAMSAPRHARYADMSSIGSPWRASRYRSARRQPSRCARSGRGASRRLRWRPRE